MLFLAYYAQNYASIIGTRTANLSGNEFVLTLKNSYTDVEYQ